jgi:phage shock protein PspC (stress-responsive transcriptional regulator)
MRQVIIVSLNNKAYHFDDDAYNALRRYLRRARTGLKNNPDVSEILADLERSIAEKCDATLSPGKNVVNEKDIVQILTQMGPVVSDGGAGEGDTDSAEPRRLGRQPRGAIIYGVCSGLAAYFDIDPIIVRIGFLVLLLSNPIGGTIAYILMRIVMPSAQNASSGETSPRAIPVLMAAAAVLIIYGAMSLPMSPFGIDYQILHSPSAGVGPFWFWGGRMGHWGHLLGLGYSLVVLGVIVAVGVAATKYLVSRSGMKQ